MGRAPLHAAAVARRPAGTPTSTLTHSHSLTLTHPHSLQLTLTHSLSLTLTHYYSRSLSNLARDCGSRQGGAAAPIDGVAAGGEERETIEGRREGDERETIVLLDGTWTQARKLNRSPTLETTLGQMAPRKSEGGVHVWEVSFALMLSPGWGGFLCACCPLGCSST